MKFFCLALVAAALSSCNTTIGIGRDIKEGFIWSKNKIQEKRQQSRQDSYQDNYQESYQDTYQDPSGAPVY